MCKRIRRLPLEPYSMSHLKVYVKNQFTIPLKYKNPYHNSPIDAKAYKKVRKLTDEILWHEDWSQLSVLLDFIFKDIISQKVLQQQYNAFKEFNNMSYDDVRDIYPSVQLYKLLPVLKDYHNKFDQELSKDKQDFSVSKFFNIDDIECKFKVLERSGKSAEQSALNEVQRLYSFLLRNRHLSHLSLQLFEVAYPSDKYGRPMNIVGRDKLLQKKLIQVKSIIHDHRPLTKDIIESIELLYRGASTINPTFFKFMSRKHNQHKFIRKGNKRFIPTPKNITKLYKDYFVRQCYYDTELQSYFPNPLLYYQ